MQKIIPLYVEKIGNEFISKIIGLNTNRIHNDIAIRVEGDKTYTKIRYYIDPAKDATEDLLITEAPGVIYREMDKASQPATVNLSLVGGGTAAIATANIIYCYLDDFTYERCSIDAIVGGRRELYKLDMTFMELLTEINSI